MKYLPLTRMNHKERNPKKNVEGEAWGTLLKSYEVY